MNSEFQIFITQDGSPTLVWTGDEGQQEKMHHSHGALSESLYIYHAALSEAASRRWPLRVLSLGLGLGYNELIALAADADAHVWSFEISDLLRENFRSWLKGVPGDTRLQEVYAQVNALVAEKFQMQAVELQAVATRALEAGRLDLRGEFPKHANGIRDCTCVFYDAFSKKMSPDLWNEDMVKTQLGTLTAKQAVVTTYAATGALNRALTALGFQLQNKKGFSGKRESTLAIRE